MFSLIVFITSLSVAVFDYNGVIGDGQSLSVGAWADPVYTTIQPFNNLKLSLGSQENNWPLDPYDPEFSLVPLVEPIRTVANDYPSAYPKNIYGETPHTVMANTISSLDPSIITIHTVVGENGQGMEMLKKGAIDDGSTGRAYIASLFEIQAISNLAKKAGKTYGVNGLILTHGETDAWSPTYQSEIVELHKNYTEDIHAITGQTEDLVFILSQQHSVGEDNIAPSTLAVWKAQEDIPGSIILACPKYQYYYYTDGIHLQYFGYDYLGEKYGEVYTEVVVKGNKNWRPLQPITAVRVDANTINVTFNVPNPPLVWDTVFPAPAAREQWRRGRGFELTGGGNALTISSAEISGKSVLIIADQALPAGTIKVGYAATAHPTKRENGTVRWGLLKDSDDTLGYSSREPMPNWAISFEMDVV